MSLMVYLQNKLNLLLATGPEVLKLYLQEKILSIHKPWEIVIFD